MYEFTATANDQGRTIFKYIIKMMSDLPLSRIEKMFRLKDVKINGKRIKEKNYIVQKGDKIVIYGVKNVFGNSIEKKKADITFRVVFEDKNILVVDKKSGVKVHDDKNSLDNQVLTYLQFSQKDSFIPSHVGRLDKNTSGLMLYAKNYSSLRELNEKNAFFTKIYEFKSDLNKDIETRFNISHDENYMREVCGTTGAPTHTKFWLKENKKFAQLFTGKKHQIRATLSKLNFPIFGDRKYGGKKARRLFLHSTRLKLDNLAGTLEYLNGSEYFSKPEW